MKTDDLIRTLAADNATQERPVSNVLLVALLLAVPVSAAMLLATLGMRKDFMNALGNPFFDLKFAVTIALAGASIAISLHLSRPEQTVGRWGWLLAIPVGLLGIGIMGDMMMPQRTTWSARLIGHNSRACVMAIPLLSLPVLAAALLALRRGAPSRPALAGAFAGLLAAGLAAAIYASHCTDDSPLFVATWYTLAVAAVAGIGAFAGSKMLKY
jgi:hypothetical protein